MPVTRNIVPPPKSPTMLSGGTGGPPERELLTTQLRVAVRAGASIVDMMCGMFGVVGITDVPRTFPIIQPIVFLMLLALSRIVARYALVLQQALDVLATEARDPVEVESGGRA